MKKTLFLALVFAGAAVQANAAHTVLPNDTPATSPQLYEKVYKYDAAGNITTTSAGTYTLTGNITFTKNELAPGNSGTAITFGSPKNNAYVVLAEGVTYSAPNSLFLGGDGYNANAPRSGNAVMVMNPGSSIQVAAKCTSTGGSHVDVGNSQNPCRGELYMNGASLTAAQLVIGNGAAVGYVYAKDSEINLSNEGLGGNQVGLDIGYLGKTTTGTGTLILDNSTLNDRISINQGNYIGFYGYGALELKNGAEILSANNWFFGDYFNGAYSTTPAEAHLTIGEGSTMSVGGLYTYKSTTLENKGTLIAKEYLGLDDGKIHNGAAGMIYSGEFDGGAGLRFENDGILQIEGAISLSGADVINKGYIAAQALDVDNGASVYNKGVLNIAGDMGGYAYLHDNSTLVTGTVLVSGRENAAHVGEMSMEYADTWFGLGLGDRILLSGDDKSTMTIGSYLEGKDATQHLYSEDFAAVDAYIREQLPTYQLNADAPGGAERFVSDQLNVVHVLGKNIESNVTTDEVSENGDLTLALSGSKLVVRVGDNDGALGVAAADKQASAEKVGTLGSYVTDAVETKAGVRLHETAENSSIAWEGHFMKTVANEEATINDTTAVSIGTKNEEGETTLHGTLTVVETSTLKNHGEVSTNVVEVNGTLDNNGAITADETKVAQGAVLKGSGSIVGNTVIDGTLVVGNSPGQQNFTGDVLLGETADAVFSIGNLSDVPADAEHGLVGWGAAANSQIVIHEGALTLADGVTISIEFGGDTIFNDKKLSFGTYTVEDISLTLVSGGCSDALIDVGALTAATTLTMTEESAGQPALGGHWDIDFGAHSWEIVGEDLVLHIDSVTVTNPDIVPEPATATLSLLALAGLCARRRRH